MDKIDADNYEIKEELLYAHKKGLMFTRTGYGSKIPTTKKIKYNNRWYRIYCQIYSNCGTCYINTKQGKIIID